MEETTKPQHYILLINTRLYSPVTQTNLLQGMRFCFSLSLFLPEHLQLLLKLLHLTNRQRQTLRCLIIYMVQVSVLSVDCFLAKTCGEKKMKMSVKHVKTTIIRHTFCFSLASCSPLACCCSRSCFWTAVICS